MINTRRTYSLRLQKQRVWKVNSVLQNYQQYWQQSTNIHGEHTCNRYSAKHQDSSLSLSSRWWRHTKKQRNTLCKHHLQWEQEVRGWGGGECQNTRRRLKEWKGGRWGVGEGRRIAVVREASCAVVVMAESRNHRTLHPEHGLRAQSTERRARGTQG